jgi:hypothetical protein
MLSPAMGKSKVLKLTTHSYIKRGAKNIFHHKIVGAHIWLVARMENAWLELWDEGSPFARILLRLTLHEKIPLITKGKKFALKECSHILLLAKQIT